MNVQELIKILESYPSDMPILTHSGDGYYSELEEKYIEIDAFISNTEKFFGEGLFIPLDEENEEQNEYMRFDDALGEFEALTL